MRHGIVRPLSAPRKRTDDDAFADELATALRTAILSTSLRDRSAVESVADAFAVEPATVYNWLEGRTKRHALRDFCRLLDACIAGKGDDNPNALEPARLIRRLYLDGAAPRQTRGVVAACASAMAEAGEAISTAIAAAQDGHVSAADIARVEVEIDEAIGRLHVLRLEVHAAAGRSASFDLEPSPV